MENFYKKILAFLVIFLTSFSFTISTTNAFQIVLEEENEKLFNMKEFKLFYKIKYLKYVILEKQKIIKLQKLGEKTNYKHIDEEKFNKELFWASLPVFFKIKINSIIKNIFLLEDEIEIKIKIMNMFEIAENIEKKSNNKNVINAMKYLKIRLALNF